MVHLLSLRLAHVMPLVLLRWVLIFQKYAFHWCFMFVTGIGFLLSGSNFVPVHTNWSPNHRGLHHCNPLEYIHGRHMCLLMLVCAPYRSTLGSCILHHWTQTAVPQSMNQYGRVYSFGNSAVTHQSTFPTKKVLLPYVKFPCYKGAQHREFHFLFFIFSHIV